MKKSIIAVLISLLFVSNVWPQNGVVKGKIADARTQETLIGAAVMVKELPGVGTISNIDGEYDLSLPAGKYTVVASYVAYATLEITNVEIKSGVTISLDIDMKEDLQELQEVIVVGRMDMEAEKALMVERQRTTVAVENLGHKEMSLKGLSTVADGIKKITGISMEGNSKVYVRGLGDRYSMTSLNGFPIASPNPDNKLIPLTLFPTSIVKNISVSKVYRASVSGDYSGAHINVDTKENIGKDYLSIGVSVGGRTNAVFGDFYSSDKQGAGLPFLGIAGGLELKDEIKNMTVDNFESWQRTNTPFKTGFSIDKQTALPSIGIDFGLGKSWETDAGKLSMLLAAGFNNDYTCLKDAYVSTINAQGIVRDRFDYDKYTYETTSTLLAQVGYAFGRSNRLSYNAMLINNTEDSYLSREGTDAEGMNLVGSNSVYHAYQLFNNQLTGKHELLANKLFADWQASYGQTTGHEPDRRQVMFTRNDDGSLSLFKLNQQETMRYFGQLSEHEWNADAKLKLLIGGTDEQTNFLRIGGALRSKSRDFYSANFYYNIKNISPEVNDIYHTDNYLNYDHIAAGTITINKNSLPRNKYYAGADTYAFFTDMEYYPAPGLLLSVGLRYEYFSQWTRFWRDGGQEERAELTTHDLFPALNVKYTVNKNANLRMGISRTVTRPSFLEMSPFEYKESYGSVAIRGNENIKNGYNYNLDLRYELFHGFGDMYSFGVFGKYLQKPIERVQQYSGSLIQSFLNVNRGTVLGAEVEIRKQIAKNWKVDFNASYIYTRISLPKVGLYTDKKRQLQGASPYLLNLDVNYAPKFGLDKQLSLSAVYNLQGPRISSVGINNVNNVMEEALHSLDFIAVYSFAHGMKLKFQAKNLLNAERKFTQKINETGKDETIEHFCKGMELGVGFSVDF